MIFRDSSLVDILLICFFCVATVAALIYTNDDYLGRELQRQALLAPQTSEVDIHFAGGQRAGVVLQTDFVVACEGMNMVFNGAVHCWAEEVTGSDEEFAIECAAQCEAE
jgi:hypothetical protein